MQYAMAGGCCDRSPRTTMEVRRGRRLSALSAPRVFNAPWMKCLVVLAGTSSPLGRRPRKTPRPTTDRDRSGHGRVHRSSHLRVAATRSAGHRLGSGSFDGRLSDLDGTSQCCARVALVEQVHHRCALVRSQPLCWRCGPGSCSFASRTADHRHPRFRPIPSDESPTGASQVVVLARCSVVRGPCLRVARATSRSS